MKLRDWLAGQALTGLCVSSPPRTTVEDMARSAYQMADAMLANRRRTRLRQDDQPRGTTHVALLDAFQSDPARAWTPAELEARTGIHCGPTIRNTLARMQEEGVITRVGYGQYRLTPVSAS